MDLSVKHNVIAIYNNKLQLWDTATNEILISYEYIKNDCGPKIFGTKIKCNIKK